MAESGGSDANPCTLSAVNRTTEVDFVEAAFALGVPRGYGRLRGLHRVREPTRLTSIGRDTQGREQYLAARAARAWMRMREAAVRDGVELEIVSAFRSIEYQLGILRRKLERGQSMDEILRVSAAPGYSEHHSGRALDVTTPGYAALEEAFERSSAFAWLRKNAKLYKFTLSYPRGNRHGIAYEPWHWCWHAKI
ncbi:MAG: D-alanyl-D-alanine carboxypeptidase family protein [Proteobacteria bacterium]|nr:D-alanyl-D-alanine carboxypeptidase family protein [Pseudomonadota bacterium]